MKADKGRTGGPTQSDVDGHCSVELDANETNDANGGNDADDVHGVAELTGEGRDWSHVRSLTPPFCSFR